jgi:hypothetical protein
MLDDAEQGGDETHALSADRLTIKGLAGLVACSKVGHTIRP